ncbi:unnamed protein product [Lactuca virosa]|uniref:RAB6-interacting golgin n=1 Tax=Lactuca virosa TaxID=75947 RepID=A0AAU9LER2_9ASTR|nr:unnamed protein product [Lactuca virosa]
MLSSTIETSILDTSTSLPPLSSPIPSSLPVSTISPTYSTIMQEPVTTLLSSQSTKVERIVQDNEPNDDDIMKQQVKRLEVHAKSFEYEILKLREIAKEHHELFIEHMKTMKESVYLKMAELKLEIAKEVENIEKSYFVLHRKVDVVADAIEKLIEYNTAYSTKLDVKTEKDS